MGAIHFSIDTGLVDTLKKNLPLKIFVETGTFEGASLRAVEAQFKKLYSIELSEDYFKRAKERFQHNARVEIIHGNSATVLKLLEPDLQGKSVLFWLDAHWCVADEGTAGEKSQCPLLQEIEAIGTLGENSALLIDDARLFLATPPAPHEASDWPDCDTIVRQLFSLSPNHTLMVLNDTFVFVPRRILPSVQVYARNHSYDLLKELNRSRQFDEIEADRAKRLEAINVLKARLEEVEADRAKRL